MKKKQMRAHCRLGLLLAVASTTIGTAHAAGGGAELFVSPSGDDANPGTAARPLRTLQQARDRVRAMAATANGDITVTLAGGVYRLAQPLTFGPEDSGAKGHDVIYRAAPGAKVVVSGGVAVTGWKLADPSRNLWSAPAPAGLSNTRQLYVNGVRALRTRGRVPVNLVKTETGYTADADTLSQWRNPGDIEFVYTGGNALWSEGSEGLGAWTEPRIPLASIQGTTITMAQPCWDNSTRRVMLPPDSRFKRTANLVGPASVGKQPAFMENAYELLGTPGQWYFDRSARTIYYVPRPGEDLSTADVEVPALETLIVGEGTKERPIHNLVFSGIQFSYGTWLGPSGNQGFSEIQANYCVTGPKGYATQALGTLAPGGTLPYGAWTKTPGNVVFRYADHIRFLRDAFVHLGAAGLELGNGSQFDTVQGCVFTDISANGLELGGVDLPLGTGAEITRDNQIRDNHFYEIAAEYHGGVGIDVGYAQRTLIQHNQLDHLPYTAISMGWGGWPDKIEQAGQANNSQNNRVADNLIFDHLELLADGGGIYTQGLTGPTLADGEKITGNVIHDQFSSGHAIYTDNGCKNVTMKGNVLFHTNHDNWGSRHRDYYDGNAGKTDDAFDGEDNYWQQGDPDISRDGVTLKNNHLINALDQAPASVLQNAGLESDYWDILTAIFANPSAPEPPSRVAASGGNGLALVSWNPPVLQGGAPVQSYTVTASTGQKATISAEAFRAAGYVTVSGLTNGTACTFTVTAVNANGTSAPSLPSRPITPGTLTAQPPSAPAVKAVHAGEGMASIHFQAPASDGGSPIVAYKLTASPGGRTVTLGGRIALTLSGTHTIFAVVDGLKPGQSYTFTVTAVNAAGVGAVATTKPVTVSSGAVAAR